MKVMSKIEILKKENQNYYHPYKRRNKQDLYF